MQTRYYLLFDRIYIENANAISSPITYGFPAVGGFVGAIHALSRKIPTEQGIALNGVLIACHECDIRNFRPHSYADYSFIQTRNPIKKDGKTAAIVEEGKVHLTISLVVEVLTEDRNTLKDPQAQENFIAAMQQKLMRQRIAGGSVRTIEQVRLYRTVEYENIIQQLIPAFVLVEAQQDLAEVTSKLQEIKPQATALDALIETATLHHTPQADDTWQTSSIKTGHGWLVPIPIGYQSISPIFEATTLANSRSAEYPSQYVECLYSLGKWVFPYRLVENFTDSFWRYQQPQPNLYLFTQTVN